MEALHLLPPLTLEETLEWRQLWRPDTHGLVRGEENQTWRNEATPSLKAGVFVSFGCKANSITSQWHKTTSTYLSLRSVGHLWVPPSGCRSRSRVLHILGLRGIGHTSQELPEGQGLNRPHGQTQVLWGEGWVAISPVGQNPPYTPVPFLHLTILDLIATESVTAERVNTHLPKALKL